MLAIYCRKSSTPEPGKDYSIENQEMGGLKLARELGMTYQVYKDEGISGAVDMSVREGFGQMMGDIRKGKVKAVYCLDQSRIERNTRTWDFFAGECVNFNVQYYPDGKLFDLTDDNSRFFANLLSLVNNYYAVVTSKKVKLANYRKAEKGKTHGLKAYGYKRDEENNFVVFEDEAKHVRRMFELSLAGNGAYTIANIFNAEGVPTKFNLFKGTITKKGDEFTPTKVYEKAKVRWRGNVISDMLRNELYKGIRVWGDLRVTVAHIVTPELWNAVNENLSQNKLNVGPKVKYNYLLNGILFCQTCGYEMVGKVTRTNDNAYKCTGKRQAENLCEGSRGLSLAKLDTFIIQHLFNSRELKQKLIEAPRLFSDTEGLKADIKAKNLEKESLIRRRKRYVSSLKDEFSDDLLNDLLKEMKSCDERIIRVESEIEKLSQQVYNLEDEGRNQKTKGLIESYTDAIGFYETKRIVHSLIDRIALRYLPAGKKPGQYLITVSYRNYKSVSEFSTNRDALNWKWLRYHNLDLTLQEQADDFQNSAKYLKELEDSELTTKEMFDRYMSFELAKSDKGETIYIDREDLINFNEPY